VKLSGTRFSGFTIKSTARIRLLHQTFTLAQLFCKIFALKLGAVISTAPIQNFGESEMTELKVLVLGVIAGLLVVLVGFSISALASWLTMRDRNKQLSHYIETLRDS
jgi:hypothetical protein